MLSAVKGIEHGVQISLNNFWLRSHGTHSPRFCWDPQTMEIVFQSIRWDQMVYIGEVTSDEICFYQKFPPNKRLCLDQGYLWHSRDSAEKAGRVLGPGRNTWQSKAPGGWLLLGVRSCYLWRKDGGREAVSRWPGKKQAIRRAGDSTPPGFSTI